MALEQQFTHCIMNSAVAVIVSWKIAYIVSSSVYNQKMNSQLYIFSIIIIIILEIK